MSTSNDVYHILLWIVILALIITHILVRFYKKRPDGHIIVRIDSGGKKIFSLELNRSPEEIEHMEKVVFKVVPKNGDDDDIAD